MTATPVPAPAAAARLAPAEAPFPYTIINIFTPTGGTADRLLDMQMQEIARLSEAAGEAGWLGNEVYWASDSSCLVVITRFTDAMAAANWRATPDFAAHLERIAPLIARVDSIPVELIAAHAPRRG